MGDDSRLHSYLLGRFRLEGAQGLIRLPTRKVELLLAYLALHPQRHTRDKLATLNWGEFREAQAKASLRNALATLRKQAGDDLLLADRETVQLNPLSGLWVDALEFRAQATTFLAEPLPDPTTLNPELYQGELLTDFDADWLLAEREYYHVLYQDALLRLIQQLRVRGEYAGAIKLSEQLLAYEPANEPAHQHLMFCYLAIGERHKALKQYESCLRLLQEELGVEPQPETVALYQRLKKSAPSASAPELLWTNLPNPLTSFVGREPQVAEIKDLLQTSTTRLLTLVGSGGSGKTRLALQVARQVAKLFEAGVWWVELAPVADPAFVPQAVAKVLSIRESSGQSFLESLISYLRSRQLLLVLDNCEHLIIACAQLAEALLQACPQLQILATSRETLGVTGEYLWPVPSLAVPEPSLPLGVDELKSYEAIQLFMERAKAIRPDFKLTPQNGPTVAQICRRLDGIPLALELAAARIKVLPPEQIAARLDNRFNLLTGGNRAALPRQQTLRATMDWSYELLEAEEQLLF
jgi:DNA-binding SARP family transcriptional activator